MYELTVSLKTISRNKVCVLCSNLCKVESRKTKTTKERMVNKTGFRTSAFIQYQIVKCEE